MEVDLLIFVSVSRR